MPIAREPAFSPDACWVNIMDPIDPVSGVLKSFNSLSHACCPSPQNIGYRAGWVLLLTHLQYLSPKGKGQQDLPSATVAWLLGDKGAPGSKGNPLGGVYPVGKTIFCMRDIVAWVWWIVGFAVLLLSRGWSCRLFSSCLAPVGQRSFRRWTKNGKKAPAGPGWYRERLGCASAWRGR